MARLLPMRSDTESPAGGPRVLDLEGEDADDVFSALSSDTARAIYRTLHEEPHAPSEVAEAVDTSIQNVRYHLDNLQDAGLVEVVDTWYSSRGNEMSVYAPASDALVLASGEEQTSQLRTALSRLVSGIVVLGLASLALQEAIKTWFGNTLGTGGGGSGFSDQTGDSTDRAGGAVGDAQEPAAESGTTTATDGGVDLYDATTAPEATETAAGTTRAATDVQGTTAEPVANGVNTSAGTTTAGEPSTTTALSPDGGVATTTQAGGDLVGNIPPGALFFAGGAVVLLVVVGYLYWRGM